MTCDLGWRAPHKAYTLDECDRAVGERASNALRFCLGTDRRELTLPTPMAFLVIRPSLQLLAS